MLERELSKKVKALAKKFPVVAILGPRQSGKTTLSKMAFPNYKYVSLEHLSKTEPADAFLVYGSEEKQTRKHGKVVGWSKL